MKRHYLSIVGFFASCCAFAESLKPVLLTDGTSQEEITSQYIVNPSFETDGLNDLTPVNNSSDGLRGYTLAQPTGWSVVGTDVTKLLITKDCYTDNNFGVVTTIPEGEKAYYLRMGWSTGNTTVKQTLKSLPSGNYLLSVAHRTGYANSASSSFSLNASGEQVAESFVQGSTGFFAAEKWNTTSLPFETSAEGDVEISVAIDWLSGGSCIMIDQVRLYKLSGEYMEPEDPTEDDVESPTEGVITHEFVEEGTMKDDLLQMLANFSLWMKNDFQLCTAPNSIGEECGCFKGESTMNANEQGVRPNADLSMVCAFLVKYGKDKVTLPVGVTWEDLETIARKSLVFAYSTHKANRLKVCSNNGYWGSTSNSDHVWESSLWAMSVAYSAFFQWDTLSDAQKNYIKAMLVAECNYELQRSIPTGYAGDTKAEENGWETNILAATLGLYPDHELATKWFNRLREFAINCYSHVGDGTNQTIIDPEYDQTTVADLYKGQNLYDDYTLQNHNLFHTSYQNVVMQELGESALALKMFQTTLHGQEKWKTNALMHNNQKVMDEVLNWLALADGELAMPNGNDWSLFLYDQITSYSTMACFLRDPNALMLENLAYKYIKARQATTADGSWLLRADVGARRMGVEAHRVMMTWLMHEYLSTKDVVPTQWDDFNERYAEAKILKSQNIVRAATADRFTCFSWSSGLSSYTGYIAANNPDKNKIIVPYRANNTGNFLGWYTVSGKGTNATPVVSGIYELRGNAWTMNGELNTNDAALNNRFALYSTPGNAVLYVDYVRGNTSGTITKEQGGLMAISTDEFTKTARTLYTAEVSDSEEASLTHKQLDGAKFTTFETNWINIDNQVGILSQSDKLMAFGDKANNNSIMTSKIYPSYSATARSFKSGDVVDRRNIVYYSNLSAEKTAEMSARLNVLTDSVPQGWNGVIAADPDGACYMLLSNFVSDEKCLLDNIACELGAPVFSEPTLVVDDRASATFAAEINHSISNVLRAFVKGAEVTAIQSEDDSCAIYLMNLQQESVKPQVSIVADGRIVSGEVVVAEGGCMKVYVQDGALRSEEAQFPTSQETDWYDGYTDVTADYLVNANFDEDATYGNAKGNVTLGSVNYNPCYINNVSALSGNYPNILPVKGWTAGNKLTTASKYARMYSMPYSTTMYCVSPSSVGNYAAQCARPMLDDTCGVRCLTVLNSWSAGANQITQTVTLPAGDYRLLMDMKYECVNQQSNADGKIVASGNTNTSLTGIKIQNVTDYRYPSENATWEVMPFDFTLEERTDVVVSLGFSTTAGVGAANNTLLYIDNVRLLAKNTNIPDGVEVLKQPSTGRVSVYSITGVKLRSKVEASDATNGLEPGIYLVDGKKVVVRK